MLYYTPSPNYSDRLPYIPPDYILQYNDGDEMKIDETMEIEGYEYEDDEIYFFSELVKRIKEEAILYDIFKFL